MAKMQPSEKPAVVSDKDAATKSRQDKPRSARQEGKGTKGDQKPNPITRFIRYVEASRAELRKVTWPTARETRKATIAVLGFVGIMAIILGLIDLGLSSLIKAILS